MVGEVLLVLVHFEGPLSKMENRLWICCFQLLCLPLMTSIPLASVPPENGALGLVSPPVRVMGLDLQKRAIFLQSIWTRSFGLFNLIFVMQATGVGFGTNALIGGISSPMGASTSYAYVAADSYFDLKCTFNLSLAQANRVCLETSYSKKSTTYLFLYGDGHRYRPPCFARQ